jgi:arsenical pump membrane protein
LGSSCALGTGEKPGGGDSARKKPLAGFPAVTFLTLAAAAAGLYGGHNSASAVIAILSLATIGLIIYGERFALDRALENLGLPGRDAFLPALALFIALAMGVVQPGIIPEVLHSKLQIIFLILSFALLSEGVSRSGFFAFAAYKIVHTCQGNTTTLTLYLYILTSVLTLLTTNDVVTLVMTPVIISICINAGIRNARLLLLSEFLAANTLSMATLIGSPTNIIFGLGLNITYFTYLLMMIVPAILSGMLSLIVLDWVIRRCRGGGGWFFGRWAFDNNYKIPAIVHHVQFTARMKMWLTVFTLSMLLVAVVSGLKISLLFAAFPIALASLAALYLETGKRSGSHREAVRDVTRQIKSLPYAVFFFGMTFFIFSAQMVRLGFVSKILPPFIHAHVMNDLVGGSIGTIMATGFLVNTINDLPASAFLTDLFQHIDAAGGMHIYMRIILMQSVLVGLNIGCYVTPIGALAGLLFFNIIGREERNRRLAHEKSVKAGENPPPLEAVAMPDRCDLVRFGVMNFVFVAVILGILMPFFAEIIDMLINSPEHSTKSPLIGVISLYSSLPYLGGALALFTLLRFRYVLEKGNVLLGHMREVFAVMTRVTIWSMKNRGLYLGALIMLFVFFASSLLFWAETTHDAIYGLAPGEKPIFDSMTNFVIWLMLFTTTGLGGAYNPHSALGLAMTSLLPMIVIGGVVLVSNISGEKSIIKLSQRLAKGDIPSYRIAIVNYSHKCESFIDELLYTRDASVLLLCGAAQYDRALSFCRRINETSHASHRVFAALKNADPYYNYQEYRLGEANEIYLLSDMTAESEFENLGYISRLDAVFNTETGDAAASDADMAGIGLGTQAADDMSTMPRVFIEASSARFQDLVRKSCSPRLLKNALLVTFDDDVSDFLFSDMDESSKMLNSYYGLGLPAADETLFAHERNPLEKSVIRAFELDEGGRKLFQDHFSGKKTGAAAQVTGDMRALRQIATQVVESVPESTKGARWIEGAAANRIDYADLLGVVMQINDNHMHLSIPAAAISMQSVAVEKILLRQKTGGEKPPPVRTPRIGNTGNVFIFNLNPESTSFIYALLPVLKEKKRRIVVLCPPSQIVPEDIAENPGVSILQSENIEELVNRICPVHEAAGASKHPLLRKGDRLYVFLDYNRLNPELPSIDFIDQINRRLQHFARQAAGRGDPPLSHPDIYIAVETNGPDSRFLFENFFIDKIFDASLLRQNYLNVLAKIHHRALSDKNFVGHTHGSAAEFRRAAAMARYLRRFVTEYAAGIKLRDHSGAEILLTGKSYAEAARDIGTFAVPPMQLFARVRLEAADAQGAGPVARRTFRLAEVDESAPIREDDLLLSLPVI